MAGASIRWPAIAAALVVAGLAAFCLFGRSTYPAETIGRLAALVELIDSLPREDRSAEMARLMRAHPRFRLGLVSPGATLDEKSAEPQARHLARTLGPRFSVASLRDRGTPNEIGTLVVRLPDGWSVLATLPAQ